MLNYEEARHNLALLIHGLLVNGGANLLCWMVVSSHIHLVYITVLMSCTICKSSKSVLTLYSSQCSADACEVGSDLLKQPFWVGGSRVGV